MSEPKQTVNGDVGNVVSGDVTINNYSGEVSTATQQPISLLQKRDLHRLMDELVDAGESKREMWLLLHTRLNTTTVNEMTAADYHGAVEILQGYAQRIKYLKDCNILVAKVISITDPAYRKDRDRYCLKHFGTTHLKGMSKEQLQEIFGYFDELLDVCDDCEVLPLPKDTVPQPAKTTVLTKRKPLVILGGGVIIVAAALVGFVSYSDRWASAKETRTSEENIFIVETNDNIINASIPALRSIFPGLNKYKADFLSVSSYRQKSGWRTIVLPIADDAPVRAKYNLDQNKCYINISPDGDYAKVLNTSCLKLLIDSSESQGKAPRYRLK
ncbi:hypothetical protein [Yersinia massiliensis]|uniref:Uncharacterized protein n=1 Tax=Yersinia massiliensis TaxID=419257 RepID=A0ABM6UYZ5_9GAMM|nr:hypothetical protein [Yersinia massiliensis]AVX39782.1 hypothetical protein DA391_20255 [Yersinia massiliensis]